MIFIAWNFIGLVAFVYAIVIKNRNLLIGACLFGGPCVWVFIIGDIILSLFRK